MKLFDINSEKEYTLTELKTEWKDFYKADPVNHSENFTTELFNILMATVNGRNDCKITGLTGKEVSNLIIKLRKKCLF